MTSIHSLPRSEKARLAREPAIRVRDDEFEEMIVEPRHDKDFPTSWFMAAAVSGVATVCLLFGRHRAESFGKEAYGFDDFNMRWFQLRILWTTVLSSVFAVTNLALVNRFKRAIPALLVLLNAGALALSSYAIMSSLYQIFFSDDKPIKSCPLEPEHSERYMYCVGWNQEYRQYIGVYALCAVIHGFVCACLVFMQLRTALLATVRFLAPIPRSVFLSSA